MTNPLLDKTKAAIYAKADKRLHPVIKKLVAAGQKIMFAEQNQQMMVEQLGDGSEPERIGAGVAKLIGMVFNESGKKAPMQAMIPAAVVLLCDGLDFIEEAGAAPVTPDFLAECTQAMASNVLQLFGATPEQIQGYIDKAGKGAAPTAQPQPAPPPAGIVQGGV